MAIFRTTLTTIMLLFMLTGCGLFGGTSHFVVPIESSIPLANTEVESVELESVGDSKLVAVGVFEIGRYETEDAQVLLESMRESIPAQTSPDANRIYVVLRKVLVSASNNTGLAVACVSWVLVSPGGQLLFEEQFYASRIVRLWGTMGGVKDDVHRGIAERVLKTSGLVLAHDGKGDIKPVQAENTYAMYKDAVADFPAELQSIHINFLGFGTGYYTISNYRGGSELGFARQDGSFDWPAWLEGKGVKFAQ